MRVIDIPAFDIEKWLIRIRECSYFFFTLPTLVVLTGSYRGTGTHRRKQTTENWERAILYA